MKTFLTLAFALCLSGIASAATVEEDVNHYTSALADGQTFNAETLESLAWKGISDTRVFDIIQRHIVDHAAEGSNNRNVKDQVGLYIRALGFSGQPKYRSTLEGFLNDKTYERYARTALEDITRYQKWNPVISDRATFDPKYSDDVNRILNMLHSDDFDLKKIGAKRVYFQNKDTVLLETLDTQIRATYMMKDERRSDAIAWMVKALGSAKQSKYRPLLQEVASTATDKSIVKYARKALEN